MLSVEIAYREGNGGSSEPEGLGRMEDGIGKGEEAMRSSETWGARCIRDVRTGMCVRMDCRIRDANSSV